jgi:Ca-activated chloride channel family protein
MGRTGWLAGWAGVMILAATPPLAAQGGRDIPIFGVDVELVSLNVAVTDPAGRPVLDVDEGDLAIFEDGVRQQISLFRQEEWPITLAVLIDSSGSMEPALATARAAARRLLGTLRPQDRALVAQFNRRLTILQDWTSDREALHSAVDSIETDGITALHTALYVALKDLAAQRRDGELERQALVVLSDGQDTASAVTDEQVLDLARGGEVNIYTIGLNEERRPDAPSADLRGEYLLTALARETGGRVFFPETLSDLEGVYQQIADELRTLYGVAYASSNTSRDGGWRRIDMRTLRPSLLLRHRMGYYGPSPRHLARGRSGGDR